MKKLMLLTALLMLSHKSISQTVTLNSNQAKSVIKDLIRLDQCQEEREQLEAQKEVQSSQLEKKQQENQNLQLQNTKYQSVVIQKDQDLKLKEETISDLNKIIQRKENTSIIWKIGTAVGAVLGIIIAVQ